VYSCGRDGLPIDKCGWFRHVPSRRKEGKQEQRWAVYDVPGTKPNGLGAVWFVRLMAFDGGSACKGCGVIYISLFPYCPILISSSPIIIFILRPGTPACWVLPKSSPCSLKSKFKRVIQGHPAESTAPRRFYHTQGYPGGVHRISER
jgi:hypothetical protein